MLNTFSVIRRFTFQIRVFWPRSSSVISHPIWGNKLHKETDVNLPKPLNLVDADRSEVSLKFVLHCLFCIKGGISAAASQSL